MTLLPDPFTDWDAAYLLGALSPEERHDYERHLTECAACSRAVSDLAGLPGLLALVPAEQFVTAGEAEAEAEEASIGSAVPALSTGTNSWGRLQAAIRRHRKRRRSVLAVTLVAVAAAAVAAVLVVPGIVSGGNTAAAPVAALTMSAVTPSPLTASIRLVDEPWGTRIEAECAYARGGGGGGGGGSNGYGSSAQQYALYVTDQSGTDSLVASWSAGPGQTVMPVGTTSLGEGKIARVDIRSVATGDVLLDSQPGK